MCDRLVLRGCLSAGLLAGLSPVSDGPTQETPVTTSAELTRAERGFRSPSGGASLVFPFGGRRGCRQRESVFFGKVLELLHDVMPSGQHRGSLTVS